jgi:dolichol kinase
MTKNTLTVNTTREEEKRSSGRIQFILLSAICILILVVSFMAFLKIENNLHALLILAIGTALNAFIFINGRHQATK